MRRVAPSVAGAAAALLLGLGAAVGTARAGTLFSDPYGVGAPDVLGNPADFDIRSLDLTLTPKSLLVELRLNYHNGDTSLAPFSEAGSSFAGTQVGIGDVLIQGHSFLWAIPLTPLGGGGIGGGYYAVMGPMAVADPLTRGQVLPGSLYLVTGSLSAGQVLGAGAAADLRADEPVWGDGGNLGIGSPDYTGYIPMVTSLGGPEIEIQLTVSTDQAVYDDLAGGYRVHFASTTCACDVLDGAVPEPAGLALLALAALPAFVRRPRALG
ncbi:MAG TPA: hypothetical protein VEI82_02990 [Myxococcota bacterium]|nr:hypothetical protein [Myxococcota bacterium]